jgi:hypothetical protein
MCFVASLRDVEQAIAYKKNINPRTKLLLKWHDLADMFSKQDSTILPLHRRPSRDYRIELLLGKQLTYGPLYAMSYDELEVLRDYLRDYLDRGLIRVLSSLALSPVLFIKKQGSGGLRFCVDYRKLNKLTVKDRYPIPLIQETLSRLSKAVVYTKLDIIAAFNRLRIIEGDEWKTAFKTRYGLYEYLVMPFGLANAPLTF